MTDIPIPRASNNGNWEITIKGGTFSQNWVQNAEIQEFKATVSADRKIEILSCLLNIGKQGELRFEAAISYSANPAVQGKFVLNQIKTEDLLPSFYDNWITGVINGEGEIGGNYNSSDGVTTNVIVNLDKVEKNGVLESSFFKLRGDYPLWELLNVKASGRNYKIEKFNRGGLQILNRGSVSQIKNIDIQAGRLMSLGGNLIVDDLRNRESEQEETKPLGLAFEKPSAENNWYKGELKLGIAANVFQSNPQVFKKYPIDQSFAKIWLDIQADSKIENISKEASEALETCINEVNETK